MRRKRKDMNAKNIAELNRKAREMGITYGQYVALIEGQKKRKG